MLSLGELVERCFLGSLKRFLGGLGVPTLSLAAAAGSDGVELSSAGFGFLPNGFAFRGGASGGLVTPDGAPDMVGVSAGGSVFTSSGFVGVSVRGRSA